MGKTDWSLANIVNIADDTEFGVYMRTNSAERTELAYLCAGEVSVVELSRAIEIDSSIDEETIEEEATKNNVGDADIYVPVKCSDATYYVGVDASDVYGDDKLDLTVTASESIDPEDYQTLYEFDLEDVFSGIAE